MMPLKELLSTKTDDQLKYYIFNVEKHTVESVRIALAELKSRNVELPDDIEEQIEKNIELKKSNYDTVKGWSKNVVEDIDAPEYYSQSAIYAFSIFFSVLFDSVMMAINLKNAQKEWGWPILFGLLFTGGFIYLSQFRSGSSTGFSLVINAVGVIIMYQLFWNKHIGKETKYRAKPIWIPLLVGIALMVSLIYLVIQA